MNAFEICLALTAAQATRCNMSRVSVNLLWKGTNVLRYFSHAKDHSETQLHNLAHFQL